VAQLQTEEWPDLGVPAGPACLADLLQRAVELQLHQPAGPLLVHCSAGVGRTGTFLALYKLWQDYQDPGVATIALLPTVLHLRRQRDLMVQRPAQYRYIAQCLG
jgi:tyrosine-protein phosphatase non-receptor type 11